MAIFKFRTLSKMNLGKRVLTSIWSGIQCRLRRKHKRNLTKEPYELYERLPGWYQLYVEFTNRTTWHGLKYPCLPSRYRIRQYIWVVLLLVNAGLFLYVMSLNMIKLNSFPKDVSVEVDYNDTVPFPAITICNQNLYRMTAMQESGLYDFLVNGVGTNSSTQGYCDDFQLYRGICYIPDDFWSVSEVTGTGSVVVYGEMTRSACAALCVSVNNVACSGLLYDRRERTCKISPYTGEWVESREQVVAQCNSSTPVEFYRRIRCNTNITVRCDFEDSSCLLRNDTSEKDQWMIVEAEGHPVARDNTLNLDSGHILNLLQTARRPGYKARLRSPYMNTTGRCLELFYWLQLGQAEQSEYPTISVIQVTEEREEVIVSTMKKGPADWTRLFVPLRSGIHQVVIEGMRGSVGTSGISVDDISIMNCEYFRSHSECKVNRLGRGYMGTQSVSSDGHRCLPWESINSPLVSRLPDLSPKAAGSYCRNIPLENWNSPSCFVELPSGNIQLSACNISYCECLNASYFRCDNGMCIPPNLLCNGIDDCLDNSDELRACGHKRTVECKFEDDYKCGYTTTSIGNQRWTRLSSSALPYYNGNLLRPTVSAIEQLMVIDSKLGQTGNQVQLVSPLWTFNRPTLIELTYIMMTYSPVQTTAGFYVYQLSDFHSPVRRLFSATSFTDTNLRKSSVCVPEGTYHLMFLGVQGVPYESVFGLDIVAIKGTCNVTFEPLDELFNCSFSNFCGYRFLSSSSLFTRTLTNIQNAFATDNPSATDKCSSVLNGIEGTILSPGYPSNYPNSISNCEYLIVEPNGTSINVTFVEFSVEPENDCLSDRLEITDVVAGSTRIYCGSSIPPVFKSKGNIVRIVFKTDDSVNSGRFKLAYTTRYYSDNGGQNYSGDMVLFWNSFSLIKILLGKGSSTCNRIKALNGDREALEEITGLSGFSANDYIAVMKYTGPAPPNFYSHWARLISPPVLLTTNSCLRITIVANANITILKSFLSVDGMYSERRLFASALPLGQAWHRLWISIAPSVANQKFAAVIETAISEGIVAVAVSDVSLAAGNCRLLVTNGSLECGFTELDQCGYLDESTGSVNWARVYDKISNQYYMRSVFTKSSLEEAVLTSITVTTNRTQCLRLNLYASFASAYISISRQIAGQGSSDTQTKERYRLPAGTVHIYYELPVGTYSLGMKASYPVEVLESSANKFDEVRIYGTIVTDGACQNSVYKISVTCNFDDDFACEYQPVSSFGDKWNWVNFQTFLELDMKLNGDILNASLSHGNVVLFNGSSINSRKGVLVSPATTIASPGQRMTVSVYASSNRSTSLEIYITSSMDHVSHRLLATSTLLDNDWQVLSLCLPSGSYKIVFVAYTTPGNYVAIDDVVVANASCSDAQTDSSDPDCRDADMLRCPSSRFSWSPRVVWSNVSDIRNDTIHPAGNECVYVFYTLKGTFAYNESVKISSNGSECDIYIRGNGKFTTSLSFIDSILNCTRQYLQIWRYVNGELTNDGKYWCTELAGSALVPLRFTTEDILQIHVVAMEGNPRFTMNYTYVPDDMTGYPLALYYNVIGPTDDVTLSRMAEWVSPIIPTRPNDTICLSVELALMEFSSVEVLLLEHQNLSTHVTQSVVLSTSGARGDPWRRGIFDLSLQAQTSRVQLVFYFSMTNATFDLTSGPVFVGAIRNVDIYKGSCFSTDCGGASFGRCHFTANSSCGFVDTSLNTSRWIIASERSLLETSGSCKVTDEDDYSYTGNVSSTISGRQCQRWGSQSPHLHHQDVSDYFPDFSLNETANFCRNPNNPFIARTAWCYTTDPTQRREYCDIPHCLDHFMRVEFPSRITNRAILTSPTFALRDVTCLRFRYSLTSTRVQLTAYVTSASGDDIQRKYVIDSEPTSVTWLTGELELTPTASQIVFYADKTDVTDSGVFVSIDNVTMTTGACKVSDDGNSSMQLSSRVPYRGPKVAFDEYKKIVLSEWNGTDMRNVTSGLAHQIENLVHGCDYVAEDCLGADSFKTEFTDMGQCYTFNYDQSNSFQTNATGSKNGLRLTLNIEQYEHVPDFGYGVGVKLYLHDQVEIPSMTNLGLSVPAAMHTLVSTSYTMTENLPPPFGSCGSNNLTYFGSNFTDADYTEAKCLLQDKTTYYESQCNCKDIYMPGPSEVCSLKSYFGCVYDVQDHLVPYTSTCPQACVTNTYSVETSQAQLPGLDTNKLYSGKADEIEKGYLHALEIRSRIEEPLITQTLSQLKAVVDTETLLHGYIYFAALDPATSLPGHVEAAILTSAGLITNEIVRNGGMLVSRFAQEYTNRLKPSVSYLVTNVRSLYTQLSFGRDVLLSIEAAGWSRSTDWYQSFLDETWTFLMRMNDTLVVFRPNINHTNSHLPKLFDHPECSNAMDTLVESVDELINDFPRLAVAVTATGDLVNGTTTTKLIGRIDVTLGVLLTVENCSLQYEKLLTDFRSWLDQLVFTSKGTGQTKADDILVAFNDIDSWLVELRDNYSSNAMQKKELATILLSDQTTNALQRIDNIIQDINQQVVAPMQNRIDSDEQTTSSSYLQFLQFLARMYSFTRNKYIEDAARRLLIWQEPVHNLEIPETIEYRLRADEVWQIWPTDQDLESFVATSAPSRLDLVCLQYFDPLHRKLSFFLSEVSNRRGQLNLAIGDLLKTLKEYLDSTALDETFAMKNFMVIDIYYGELKYEHITQSEGYSWSQFFSDLGSYFGLLMGCSILTMVEVIDLVLYYSIVKLIERYEERPLRQEVIDIKI